MTKSPRIERVVYDDWRDGFSSRLRFLGKNTKQWTGMNVQVYDDGTLGPRPWMRLQNTTNQVTADTIDDRMFMAWRPADANSEGELWVHAFSGDVWVYDLAAGTWAVGPAGIDTPITTSDNRAEFWGSRHDWDDSGKNVGSAQHALLPEDNWVFGGEAVIDISDTVTTINWADSTNKITCFTLYRDRIWGWVTVDAGTDPANRLYYTDAASYTASTAGNYIDIGAASDGYYIKGVWPVRDSLLIAMSNDDWYVFTGTPTQGSLRFIGSYVTPAHGACGAVLNNAVYFIAPYGRQVCIATPSGVDTVSLSDIRPWNNDNRWTLFHDYRGLASQREPSHMLPPQRNDSDHWSDAVEFVNGNWTYSGYGRDRFSDTSSNIGTLRDTALVAEGKAYAFLTSDPGADPGTHEPHLYTRDIVLNRPSRKSDEWSDSIEVSFDASSTGIARAGVRLAPFSPEGQEVRVRQVMVDFHYWYDTDNDVYETPDMRCVLIDGGRLGSDLIDTFDGTALDTFEDNSLSQDEMVGQVSRFVFRFPMEDQQFRMTQQIQIDDILSLSISRVVVDYEVRPDNHWAGQYTPST